MIVDVSPGLLDDFGYSIILFRIDTLELPFMRGGDNAQRKSR